MATTNPPKITIDDPSTTSSPSAASKPAIPNLDTSSTSTTPRATSPTTHSSNPSNPLSQRPNAITTTPPSQATCYLCDEQNPGDFSPTTKHLSACLLCSRYFCPIHRSPSTEDTSIDVCNIKHSTYYHDMLQAARSSQSASITSPQRTLAELLISEGIYPSLGEREKAIFATRPVDAQKERELESWRSLEAVVQNGGVRGEKLAVEEKSVVGADIAV
jgi:hypothetical protein